MEFIVWVETRLAGKTLGVEELAKFDRCADGIPAEDIGLTLAEAKDVVSHVQRKIVQTQIEILSWGLRTLGGKTHAREPLRIQ
jgi:hypothetical protein